MIIGTTFMQITPENTSRPECDELINKNIRVRHAFGTITDDPDYLPSDKNDIYRLEQKIEKLERCVYTYLPAISPEILQPHSVESRRNINLIPTPIKEKFERLSCQWKNETLFVSTILESVTHPAYQQIIGMGEQAVPLILSCLSERHDHWFWALMAITGENPVSPNHRGQLPLMANSWLEWGEKNGYIY